MIASLRRRPRVHPRTSRRTTVAIWRRPARRGWHIHRLTSNAQVRVSPSSPAGLRVRRTARLAEPRDRPPSLSEWRSSASGGKRALAGATLLFTIGSDPQPRATVGNAFGSFCRFGARTICDWLPPVATTGLHRGSIVCWQLWVRSRRCAIGSPHVAAVQRDARTPRRARRSSSLRAGSLGCSGCARAGSALRRVRAEPRSAGDACTTTACSPRRGR